MARDGRNGGSELIAIHVDLCAALKVVLFQLAFLTAIAGASFLVAPGAVPSGDAPLRIETRTELFAFGAIHLATNRTRVETGLGHYTIVVDTESRGIGSIFVDLRTHSEVQGAIVMGRLRPKIYRGEVHRNGADAYARVDYGDDGSVTAQADPPARSINADPAMINHSIDPMTAFFCG